MIDQIYFKKMKFIIDLSARQRATRHGGRQRRCQEGVQGVCQVRQGHGLRGERQMHRYRCGQVRLSDFRLLQQSEM